MHTLRADLSSSFCRLPHLVLELILPLVSGQAHLVFITTSHIILAFPAVAHVDKLRSTLFKIRQQRSVLFLFLCEVARVEELALLAYHGPCVGVWGGRTLGRGAAEMLRTTTDKPFHPDASTSY